MVSLLNFALRSLESLRSRCWILNPMTMESKKWIPPSVPASEEEPAFTSPSEPKQAKKIFSPMDSGLMGNFSYKGKKGLD